MGLSFHCDAEWKWRSQRPQQGVSYFFLKKSDCCESDKFKLKKKRGSQPNKQQQKHSRWSLLLIDVKSFSPISFLFLFCWNFLVKLFRIQKFFSCFFVFTFFTPNTVCCCFSLLLLLLLLLLFLFLGFKLFWA